MQATITHTIGDKEVTIKELSVAEIRQIMAAEAQAVTHAEASAEPRDVVGEILCEMSLNDILSMTNLTKTELENLRPSQINQLAEKCMEVNAAFFDMARKIKNTVTFLNTVPKSA